MRQREKKIKMAHFNSTVSIVTLNINGLSTPKRDRDYAYNFNNSDEMDKFFKRQKLPY